MAVRWKTTQHRGSWLSGAGQAAIRVLPALQMRLHPSAMIPRLMSAEFPGATPLPIAAHATSYWLDPSTPVHYAKRYLPLQRRQAWP